MERQKIFILIMQLSGKQEELAFILNINGFIYMGQQNYYEVILVTITQLTQLESRRAQQRGHSTTCHLASWTELAQLSWVWQRRKTQQGRCKTSNSSHLSHTIYKLRSKFKTWMSHKSLGHLKLLCKRMWITNIGM